MGKEGWLTHFSILTQGLFSLSNIDQLLYLTYKHSGGISVDSVGVIMGEFVDVYGSDTRAGEGEHALCPCVLYLVNSQSFPTWCESKVLLITSTGLYIFSRSYHLGFEICRK